MHDSDQVLVALTRPSGYEDVRAELVAEDAMDPAWQWRLISDEGSYVVVGILRPEEYERTAAAALARAAIRSTWPWWHVVRT
jgi:hypothetical protein